MGGVVLDKLPQHEGHHGRGDPLPGVDVPVDPHRGLTPAAAPAHLDTVHDNYDDDDDDDDNDDDDNADDNNDDDDDYDVNGDDDNESEDRMLSSTISKFKKSINL